MHDAKHCRRLRDPVHAKKTFVGDACRVSRILQRPGCANGRFNDPERFLKVAWLKARGELSVLLRDIPVVQPKDKFVSNFDTPSNVHTEWMLYKRR